MAISVEARPALANSELPPWLAQVCHHFPKESPRRLSDVRAELPGLGAGETQAQILVPQVTVPDPEPLPSLFSQTLSDVRSLHLQNGNNPTLKVLGGH